MYLEYFSNMRCASTEAHDWREVTVGVIDVLGRHYPAGVRCDSAQRAIPDSVLGWRPISCAGICIV